MKKFRDPYVIAEIGINHNGNSELATLMCDLSIKAGASAVKFQLFEPDELVLQDAEMADYQKNNSSISETQHQMLSRNKIDLDALKKCRVFCRDNKVDFICTAFNESSLSDVLELKPDFIKWPSGEIDNIPFLQLACRSKLPIIMSTGMADTNEIKDAVEVCVKNGINRDSIVLLHCTSQYPTPIAMANVNSVSYLKTTFNTLVGFSDHTMGSFAAQLALACGAKVFEKHVSISRLMDGVDHKASATFDELKEYINDLNFASTVLGSPEKTCFPIEAPTKPIARKSLVAKVDIKTGEELSGMNLTAKRPGNGISPKYLDELQGKRANKDISSGHVLAWTDIAQ